MEILDKIKAVSKITDRVSGDLSREMFELPYPEVQTAFVLGTHGPQSIIDISHRTFLDKSQASRTVLALRQREICEGEHSEEDKRSIVVKLTDAGKILLKQMGLFSKRRNKGVLFGLQPAEIKALDYLLTRILASHGVTADE